MLVCWKGTFFSSFSYIHNWCYKSFSFSLDLYVVCPWYLLILLLQLVLVSQEQPQIPVSQEYQQVPVSQEGQVVQFVPFRSSAYVVLKKKHADVKTPLPMLFRLESAPPPLPNSTNILFIYFFFLRKNPRERGWVLPLTNKANLSAKWITYRFLGHIVAYEFYNTKPTT